MSAAGEGGGRRGGLGRGLGRGLSALLGEEPGESGRAGRPVSVPIDRIEPGRAQPRRAFDRDELEALAESIRARGVLQPVLLRRRDPDEGGERYELVAGERRWRAAQLARRHEIPAILRDFDDREALEIALVENIQRSDLAPLEEAEGYRRLTRDHGRGQAEVARAVGKSRAHVANTLRLLALPPAARAHLEAGRLTAGHARALLAAPDADRLADYVVAGGLTVRATEKLVQERAGAAAGEGAGGDARPRARRAPEKDADTRALERRLSDTLGLRVEIAPGRGEGGAVTVRYRTLEQLDGLLARLSAVYMDGGGRRGGSVEM